MLYKAANMKERFQTDTPQRWAGGYAFDGDWANRWQSDPWCWFAHPRDAAPPHFTAYANDFRQDDTLFKFHIPFNYRGQAHKPVHVHYRFNANQSQTRRSHTDANRVGRFDKNAAEQYVGQNLGDFNRLAQAFVLNVFAMPGLPTPGDLANAISRSISSPSC